MIKQQAPNTGGSYRPVVIEFNDLDALQTYFIELFIPQATELIGKEVRIGVPSGRIVDIMGTELRFATSFKLIQRFLNDHYRGIVRQILERESIRKKPGGDMLLLRSIQIVIDATKRFFFETLLRVIVQNKLQPILESLDQIYKELFEPERDKEIFEMEVEYLRQLSDQTYADLLKFGPEAQKGLLFAN